MEPKQLGVGTKFGCEAAVHVVRQWLARNKGTGGLILCTLDLRNAFNSIDRSAVLDATQRRLPAAYPWAHLCYGTESHLVMDQERLSSSRGVQQGDPFGPVGFATGIHDAITETNAAVAAQFPGEIHLTQFFLDDGIIAGTQRAVALWIHTFRGALAARGMDLNDAKCEAIPTDGRRPDPDPEGGQLLAGFKWCTDGNFKLLGAPFGSVDFCSGIVRERVQKGQKLLRAVAEMPHTQAAVLIARQTASWARLVYLSRVTPPDLISREVQEFSGTLRAALGEMLGDTLSDTDWTVASISIRQGGMGFRDAERHGYAAYVASVRQCSPLAAEMDPDWDHEHTGDPIGMVKAEEWVKHHILPSAVLSSGPFISQKHISYMLDEKTFQDVWDAGDPNLQAHLSLMRLPTAGVWLTAAPRDETLELDGGLAAVAFRRRLRMRQYATTMVCPACGATMDAFGDHSLVCICTGDRNIRHNSIRNDAFECAKWGNLRPDREKSGLLPGRPKQDELPNKVVGGRRPADVFLPRGVSGKKEAWDFTVRAAAAPGALRATARDPGKIFHEAERQKANHLGTAAACEGQGIVFKPLVLEALSGAFSPALREAVQWLAKQVAAANHAPTDQVSLLIAQRLSLSLHRESARAVLRRDRNLLAPPSGADEEGSDDPSAEGWSALEDLSAFF